MIQESVDAAVGRIATAMSSKKEPPPAETKSTEMPTSKHEDNVKKRLFESGENSAVCHLLCSDINTHVTSLLHSSSCHN
jgi:hypothetical protein